MRYFLIGDVYFGFEENGYQVSSNGFFERFSVKEEEIVPGRAIVRCRNQFCNLEKYCRKPLPGRDSFYDLFDTEKGVMRVYHWVNCRFAYAVPEKDPGEREELVFYIDERMKELIPLPIERLLGCIGLHSRFLCRGAAVIHASYIDWNGQAILFAAASGTGKSTQAELWRRYAGAEVINGDRVLIRKRGGGQWYAYGYPCCGSSKICINRTLPLRAVVLLEQGAENRVVSIPDSEKICRLTAGVELCRWKLEEIDKALEIVCQLTEKVAVVKLVCRQDKEAVEVLQKYLEVQAYG